MLISGIVLLSCHSPPDARRGPTTGLEDIGTTDYVRTASGLQIFDRVIGTGDAPKVGKRVRVDYTGWLATGAVFASSRHTDEAFEFVLGTGWVIPGLEEGILTMKPGGVRLLKVPAELSYGAQGRPPIVPPNAELRFEIELLANR